MFVMSAIVVLSTVAQYSHSTALCDVGVYSVQFTHTTGSGIDAVGTPRL